MFLTEILIILATIIGLLTLWLKHHYNYWQRHKIPYIKAHPIFGNFKDIVLWKKDPCAHFQSLYDEEGVVGGKPKDNPVIGLHVFNKPCLLIRDLELVKNVLIKDFNQFSNRYSYSDPHSDAVGANTLFFAKNPKWKNIRSKLTPVFASGKIKQMFPLVEEIGRELDKYLCNLTEKTPNNNVHEVKDINALYTTDVIATVAYGVQANSLVNPNGDFRINGKRIFDFNKRRSLEFSCMFFLPKLVKLMKFKFFSPETTTFLRKTIKYVMDERAKSGLKRNDLIDILVKFRKDAETDKTHFANELDSVIAQAAIFFSAGFETSSATMSFTLYELAKHQDVQQRVREEIREALHQSENGELSYEQLNELKYLNNVILEVLRFYPPLPFLDRECTADKGYSLQPHVDFTIPPGMPVYIAANALQRDPRYFTEPEKFEPDRFNPENKLYNNLGAYMPFGVGPHNCIGERFGMIQTKVGLFNFLRNHYVTVCEKTSPEMNLSPYALIIQSADGIYLNLVRDPLYFFKSRAMWSLSDLKVFATLILILFLTLYFYLKYRYNYWTRYGVPQIPPTMLVGNLGPLLRLSKCSAQVIKDIYHHPEAKDKAIVGIYLFHTPALLIRDPELIKRILIRDFNKFCNRYSNSDVLGDPLGSQNLFFLKNPAWKEIRFKLTPFFTSGKLKQMFPLVEEVGRNLNNYLLNMPFTNNEQNSFELELKEFCALYTTDVIATVAFGVEANSFKSPNGDFRRNGRAIFHFNPRRAINFSVVFFMPHLVPYLGIKVVPDEQTEFLRSTMNYVLNEREKSGKTRNDLIDILIEFKNSTKSESNKSGHIKFEGDLLVAQAAIFFTAGFESSSATMSFALYELARNPQVQEKLRREIEEALQKTGGRITQTLVDSMEYLQMIIAETLRFYPPLPFLDRECSVEQRELYSLKPFHDYSMPSGMPAYIPVYALHMDSQYFPQPLQFKPERFSADNRKNITPYTYMPFGLGPHACIGERFAYLQTKIGLIEFLRNHRVSLSAKTSLHPKLDPKALILQSEGGIHLNIIRDPLCY
ncbi:uncharacterized protein LOC119603923 [Lucilia sericata]|uniref:uncharacterized protein LOC119603923 n=1 Tax=Lucilia sericata TaxID=13632 RepID=UPI0018A80D73|nr:uncharacterized protein LOC119603923 [Lucilia sericata]